MLLDIFLKTKFINKIKNNLDSEKIRENFIKSELEKIPSNCNILDAGCGSQQYKKYCNHLDYKSQDFGKYTKEQKKTLLLGSLRKEEKTYQYGKLNYVGDIWNIKAKAKSFDAILCTEVFEHIPYPIEAVKEFNRLLKPGGVLILTAPSNCLRHFDPYFYYSGFSDRWFEKILSENGLKITKLSPVGDYYSWLSVEIIRTVLSHSILSKLLLLPAFLFFYNKKKTEKSVNTLSMGYHVTAVKK